MITVLLGAFIGFVAGAASMLAVIVVLELVMRQLQKIFGSQPREKKHGPSLLDQAGAAVAAGWRAVRGLAVARVCRLRKWILRSSR